MSAVLELRSITKSFGPVRALRGVSIALFPGQIHALLGENGAGKSTLIKVMTGAHPPDSGEILLGGKPSPPLSPVSARAEGIACIYQQPALFPDLSVAENICLALEPQSALSRVRWKNRLQTATSLLRRIGAQFSPETEVRALSMPEQQLVEIARALGSGARVVIMDEPTASLPEQEASRLLEIVRELASQGVAVLYISHRLEEIAAIASHVTVLRDGESIATLPMEGVTHDHLVELMVGRKVAASAPLPAPSTASGPLLELQNLTCAAAGIRNLSLQIRPGEILGLGGLVGAGRTELARVLFGITPADSGSTLLDNHPVQIRSPRDAIGHGIAYLPEDRRRHGVILPMPVEQNMTMAVQPRLFPWTWIRRDRERSMANQFIESLAVKTSGPEAPVGSLSGGNQQKVALARWLATRPRLLILDEPTQGVDIGAKSEIHALIRKLASEGLAVLLISSELPELLALSHRVAVLRGGEIVRSFEAPPTPQQVLQAALGYGEKREVA
ncbi:MAG: hypothetical protein RLZZ253_1309 [Verrucomicrobiota bacterium]|jgi:rhamnose transport system ATP-binding protein